MSTGVINPADAGTASFALNSKFIPSFTGNFGALVKALKTNGNSSILSTPSVMVLNNQKATISSGKTIQMLQQTNAQPGATSSSDYMGLTSNYSSQKVNMTLEVTPQISPNKTLRLNISQTNDSLDSMAGEINGQPTVSTQSIDTSVILRSGSILVLGGLNNKTENNEVKKTPILGSIPIIGNLFTYRDKGHTKKTLMVFIRTSILNNDDENKEVSLKHYNYMREQQIDSAMGKRDSRGVGVMPRAPGADQPRLPSPF